MYFEINKLSTLPSFCSFIVVSEYGDYLIQGVPCKTGPTHRLIYIFEENETCGTL
jgi:hypothetical protein